jgi:GT2 family glycosyltransferase
MLKNRGKQGIRFIDRLKACRGEIVLGLLWLFRASSRPLGLRKSYLALVIRLLKNTRLFDRAYYLEINGDVAQAGWLPLRHYAAYGDREGRSPMPFFDPAYYRSHVRGRTKQVNALLHYAYVGRYRRISPSPWFDVDYYLRNNKDVARSGRDPLVQYLTAGGLEGRSPCPQFDGSYYLRTNPDVVESRINPLLHYLLYGRLEGRRILPDQQDAEAQAPGADAAPQPALPGEESWSGLSPRAGIDNPVVDVIVPVYKGRVETLRCLHSVLAAECRTPFELIVINDAGPDRELTEDLRRLAHLGLFTLMSNQGNRGFVWTVNRGMALHADRDVVLLNADAEVYDRWLDRLQNAARRDERTGTVTPLSNNAMICSYPRFLHDNPFPLELEYADLDALTAAVNNGFEAEAPTAVGFCVYIRRACLGETGLFDHRAFGKGYGEENDFCQRAIQKGWRNVVAADVFVRHWGSASFQGEKAKRVQAALKVIRKRYPHYHQDVDAFIKQDPLAEARRRIDWARLKRMRREKNVLIVSHNRGGGTERHIREDIERLTREGYGVFRMRPMVKKSSYALISHPAIKNLPNLPAFALTDTAVLARALFELGITEVHSHSMVDYAPDAPERVIALVAALGARYEVNLHDYKVICPRVNLADENGRYCGERGEAECNTRCLPQRGSEFGVADIRDWIAMHRRVLRAADRILVPDQDVADRLSRYFPDMHFEVSPHEAFDPETMPLAAPDLKPGEKLRVVVIGAIGKLKGFDVLRACAQDARQRNLPLEFIVMGYSMNDRLMEEAGVRVTGKYQESEALDTLNALKPHAVWLPSLWPETYSYTLSLALRAGLPVVAFDLGAIAKRLRRIDRDEFLMPLSLADRPDKVNSFLLQRCVYFHKEKCHALAG